MNAINSDTLKQYFDLLEDTMKELDLLSRPAQVYNVDESGMPLDPRAPNVIATRGAKKVRYRASGKKGQVTIVACANAAGQAIPPMLIFDAKKLNHAWTANEVPGTKYGLSDKGWINSDLFEGWLVEHFLENAVSARPLLLLLDGHVTHYQPGVIRLARAHGVNILCLSPHTTHEMQPLDCGVFAPLKSHWSRVCHDFLHRNPGKVVTKFNFNGLFSKAWLSAVVPANIVAGFRTCGVYPFSRSAVNPSLSSQMEAGSSLASQVIVSPPPTEDVAHAQLSTDEEELFRKRFEEGYDIYTDEKYVQWLKQHHPGTLPATDGNLGDHGISIAAYFSSVAPQSPVVVPEPAADGQTHTPTPPATAASPIHRSSAVSSSTSRCVAPTTTTTTTTTISTPLPSTTLADLLVYPDTSTPARAELALPRARLLTSASSLAQIEEKERRKQLEQEEREKRKEERKRKKELKEQERKRKAEERAKKTEEKAKHALQKGKGKEKMKKVATETESRMSMSLNTERRKRSSTAMTTTQVRKPRFEEEVIDPSVCCMCFGTYEEDVLEGAGADWISCACGRWLHEDCAEECRIDSDGQERFCHICV